VFVANTFNAVFAKAVVAAGWGIAALPGHNFAGGEQDSFR
jgi:hypothetical protein